jgi:pimeloyl-ACP methyl ester carboxylesterase
LPSQNGGDYIGRKHKTQPMGPEMPEHAQSFIDINGCRIALRRGGTGEPLLFLHGASGGGQWHPFLDRLAERFDVIAPEHPGFGLSDTPPWLDNMADLAYFYLDFLKALDIDRVHMVGLSIGGWLAAELGVRSTARLKTLTLVASAGIHLNGVPKVDVFLQNDELRLRDLFHDPARADRMIGQVLSPEMVDIALKNRFTTAKLTWQPRGYNPHLHKWLHRIDVPTLIVWGASDRLYPPAYAEEFHRLIPGSRVAMIPACGHLPNIEKPDVFAETIVRFAAGAGP